MPISLNEFYGLKKENQRVLSGTMISTWWSD